MKEVVVIDFSQSGHRKKYFNAINEIKSASVKLAIPNQETKSRLFLYLFCILTVIKHIKLNKDCIFIFTSADAVLPIIPILQLFNIKSIFIVHRYSRFLSNGLLTFWRKLIQSNVFYVNSTIKDKLSDSLPNSKVAFISDPLNKVILEIAPILLETKEGDFSITCFGGDVEKRKIQEFAAYLDTYAKNTNILLNHYNGVSSEAPISQRVKSVQKKLLSDIEFYSIMNSSEVFWAYRNDGADYFSGTVIEALCLGKIVIAESSDWCNFISSICPSLVCIAGQNFDVESLLKKIYRISVNDRAKSREYILQTFASENFSLAIKNNLI